MCNLVILHDFAFKLSALKNQEAHWSEFEEGVIHMYVFSFNAATFKNCVFNLSELLHITKLLSDAPC